jgi:hypothetical protein
MNAQQARPKPVKEAQGVYASKGPKMSDSKLAYYLQKFSHLRTDRPARWSAATHGHTPHKPFSFFSCLPA